MATDKQCLTFLGMACDTVEKDTESAFGVIVLLGTQTYRWDGTELSLFSLSRDLFAMNRAEIRRSLEPERGN